jgi:hypothetical protein
VNTNKTKTMIISNNKNRSCIDRHCFYFGPNQLESCTEYKYLGVIFNNNNNNNFMSNKHPYMFVTRKKKKKKKKKQCEQDISIYHEQIKRLLSSVLMTLLCRSL